MHRLGRTGRAGKRGRGVLLLTPYESDFVNSLDGIDCPPDCSINAPLNGINDVSPGSGGSGSNEASQGGNGDGGGGGGLTACMEARKHALAEARDSENSGIEGMDGDGHGDGGGGGGGDGGGGGGGKHVPSEAVLLRTLLVRDAKKAMHGGADGDSDFGAARAYQVGRSEQ